MQRIEMTSHIEARILAVIERWFYRGITKSKLLTISFCLSVVSTFLLLVPYVSLRPGLWSALYNDSVLRGHFLSQIALSGFPIVLALNLLGFQRVVEWVDRQNPESHLATEVTLEVVTRMFFFFGLHFVIFYAAATVFGSFGGNPAHALAAVAPTLQGAAWLGNLSGVYFYATAVSAVPLYMLQIRAHKRRGGFNKSSVSTNRQPLLVWSTLIFISGAITMSGIAALLTFVQRNLHHWLRPL